MMVVIMFVLLAIVLVWGGEYDLAQVVLLGGILAQLVQQNLDRGGDK